MARRRKTAKKSRHAAAAAAAAASNHSNSSSTLVLDKSLPALPGHTASSQSALQPPVDTPPLDSYIDTPGDASPRTLSLLRDDLSRQDVSPMSEDFDDSAKGGESALDSHRPRGNADLPLETLLPASTYRAERTSIISLQAPSEVDDERAGYLPMAFDPNPAPAPPLSSGLRSTLQAEERDGSPRSKEVPSGRDYFGKNHRPERLSSRPVSTRSASTEKESLKESLNENLNAPTKNSSPHVAYQAKTGLQRRREVPSRSTSISKRTTSQATDKADKSDKAETSQQPQLSSATYSPTSSEAFHLQEAPKDRKSARSTARNSPATLETLNPSRYQPSSDTQAAMSPASDDTPSSSFNPFDDPKLRDAAPTSARLPPRESSLAKPRDLGSTPMMPSTDSVSSIRHESAPGEVSVSPRQSLGSPFKATSADTPIAPPRSATRPSAPSKSVGDNGDFIAPRVPPPPPAGLRRRTSSHSELDSSTLSGTPPQTWRGHLPRHSAGGDLSMEEDMARILKGDEKARKESADGPSVLRRVSNAVRHGRSFSDRSVPSHHKTPTIGSLEISSPIALVSPMSSSTTVDEVTMIRSQLRRAQQRIAELEAEKAGLEEQVNSSADIKQVNTELLKKRSTMAFLDTQREMVVRELEVMTDHLTKAKNTNQPLDIQALKSEVSQDFANSLQKLKESVGAQIEDLVHKRNELTDDIASLIQVKDKGLQEFESLSQKNQQLSELNQQLVTSIQDMYKANAGRLANNSSASDRSSPMNGLGIYTSKGDLSDYSIKPGSLPESSSLHNLLSDTAEAEPATILTAPKVVDIRKGPPKKFWKSGALGKTVTKGLKGAFAGGSGGNYSHVKEGSHDLNGMPYSQMQAGPGAVIGDVPFNMRQTDKGGFGFFSSGQKNGLKPGQSSTLRSGSSINLGAENASGMWKQATPLRNKDDTDNHKVLFGSDLQERCEYEKRVIPAIVTRCIEEVELRGIDAEGIYRKSGGSGLVKTIQQGFDKDGGNYNISDPDLDIHAVTSALKQYFRKLPNPLITYEAYDGVLHAAQITDKEKQATTMHAAIDALPQAHRDVLEYLVQHLCRVVKMESENLVCCCFLLSLSLVFYTSSLEVSSC